MLLPQHIRDIVGPQFEHYPKDKKEGQALSDAYALRAPLYYGKLAHPEIPDQGTKEYYDYFGIPTQD
jgi:hypothetical protein